MKTSIQHNLQPQTWSSCATRGYRFSNTLEINVDKGINGFNCRS